MINRNLFAIGLVATTLISACGGGNGGDSTGPTPPSSAAPSPTPSPSLTPTPTISDDEALRLATLATRSQIEMDNAVSSASVFSFVQKAAQAATSSRSTVSCSVGSGTMNLTKGGSYAGLKTTDSLEIQLSSCSFDSASPAFYSGVLKIVPLRNIDSALNDGGSIFVQITYQDYSQQTGATVIEFDGVMNSEITLSSSPTVSFSSIYSSALFSVNALYANGATAIFVWRDWAGSSANLGSAFAGYSYDNKATVTIDFNGTTTSFNLLSDKSIAGQTDGSGVRLSPASGFYKLSNLAVGSSINVNLLDNSVQLLVDYSNDGSIDKTINTFWTQLSTR
jgi:hypothetical protein